ncbi:MAG: apolipoprotein N-acyltransferase [Alphaproteobacteria bacterium]|nr:apolipoprotein N-acyltransferase [Alphaproteobacteria bacterium]
MPQILPQNPVALRLIQPNAEQEKKWDPRYSPVYFRRQLELSAEPAKTPRDLVIWPEAAVTLWLGQAPKIQKLITEAAGPNAQAIIGIRRFEGARIYNSMAVLGQDGRAREVYDKTHLVPFGEYVPFGSFLSKFGIYGLAAEDGAGFSAGKNTGKNRRLLDLGKLGQVLPLICYESIFPNMVHTDGPRPDWILQITNDAWFGKIAGPQQHLAQARVRAVEQGLPFIRVANTGISAVIDPNGRILAQLSMGVAGKLDADLPGHFAPTFYSRTGDWLMFALLLGAAGLLGGVLRVRRFKKMREIF